MHSTDSPQTRRTADSRAVSPVIGVILMVAITVILAAVIGTFVLDIGQQADDSTPQTSLNVDFNVNTDNVTITHSGGDGLLASESRVTIENESSGNVAVWEVGNSPDSLTVGDDAVFNVSTSASDAPAGWALAAQSGSPDGIRRGVQYTVTVIDTKSDGVVFRTTFTA